MLNAVRKGVLAPYIVFALVLITTTLLSRTLLVLLSLDHVSNLDTAIVLFTNGLRVDIAVVCMAVFPAVLLQLLAPAFVQPRFIVPVVTAWLLLWCWFIFFMESATPPYMDFFNMRPGRIFFEYLESPVEIAGLLSGGYLFASLVAIILPVTCVYLLYRVRWLHATPVSHHRDRLILIVLIPLLFLGGRSTLGHRPLNPSMVAFSGDQLVNELVLNSAYSVSYAAYTMRHEEFQVDAYPDMSRQAILQTLKETAPVPPGHYLEAATTWRTLPAGGSQRKNIVVVVEESMGARFVGALGGLPLTPRIDALKKEGLWFSRLYATGIRSARGLEAIVAGFPPSSSRSVLKLGGSQHDFYTFARSLADAGYRNYFFYGGESHFDNMGGFFLSNGFHTVYDIKDMKDAEFIGVWGASDEDLFRFADRHLSREQQPFFALIFSSSFHSPFEFPDGRIELYEQPKATKHNAVKYADYAVGQFIDQAKRSNYWQDTLFLIVADHDERPRGRTLVPVESYRIPGLILGDGVPRRDEQRVTSQIDLMPTMLSLAGVETRAPTPGYNVLTLPRTFPGRAVMQYGYNHAYMEGDRVLIHQPDKPPQAYRYNEKDFSLTPAEAEGRLAEKALAWARLPSLLYNENLYKVKLPPN